MKKIRESTRPALDQLLESILKREENSNEVFTVQKLHIGERLQGQEELLRGRGEGKAAAEAHIRAVQEAMVEQFDRDSAAWRYIIGAGRSCGHGRA